MESPSRILEALEWLDVSGLMNEPEAQTLADAARFPTLLYQDCEKCLGSGLVAPNGIALEPDDVQSCPSCVESGVVVTPEAVSIMLRAKDPIAGLMALRTIGDEG